MKMWKVYDDNNNNDDGQRTNCDQKAHLSLWHRWAKKVVNEVNPSNKRCKSLMRLILVSYGKGKYDCQESVSWCIVPYLPDTLVSLILP